MTAKPRAPRPASLIPRSVAAVTLSLGDVDGDGVLDLSSHGTGAAALLPPLKVALDVEVFAALWRDFVAKAQAASKR